MSETTAQVDVLTAEVRALMVGSRQVTLSVYRQLDTVAPCDMHPFGRVRADKNTTGVELVGSLKTDGTLVRANSYKPSNALHVDFSVTEWCCHNFTQRAHGWPRVVIAGRSVAIDDHDAVARWQMDRDTWLFANKDVRDVVISEVQAEGLLHDEAVAAHTGYERLPLIILAGLK